VQTADRAAATALHERLLREGFDVAPATVC
jgi:hypothetical protein